MVRRAALPVPHNRGVEPEVRASFVDIQEASNKRKQVAGVKQRHRADQRK